MIESLYFSCYYAYLFGDIQKACMYYDFLKEEFKYNGNAETLRKDQLKQLLEIRNAIRTGGVAKNAWIVTETTPTGNSSVDFPQADLVRAIHDYGLGQLEDILSDKLELYNIEHPCNPYGKVDMVYIGRDTIYPLEVKKDQGKHDLIGQICKYDLYHKLRLHYKQYKYVRSLTVCRAYQPFTRDSLKSLNILTLLYSGEGKTLKLRSI
jgi:hypothetical protein